MNNTIKQEKKQFFVEKILPPVYTRWRVWVKERAKAPKLRLVKIQLRQAATMPEKNYVIPNKF